LRRCSTEGNAALAYNVEAERVGRPLNVMPPTGAAGVERVRRPLNVIPPTGAADAAGAGAGGGVGAKRTAPNSSAAPSTSKKMKP